MKTSISNHEAQKIWDKYLKTEYLRLHTIESEAIMRKIANHLGKDEDFWGNTGLLHDLDMDVINGNYAEHGYKTVELLKAEGFDIPEMFNAIISHTEGVSGNEAKRTTDFELILSAAENITGIISAYVILTPEKKVAGTKVSSIKKRLKSKAFAASVNREFIYDIEKAGIELDVFLQLAIDAMTEIGGEIGM
ncbi:MAG: HD domain-containing protein [Chloroflexia bacterium]|nr:HD domain-containing protein [Chloroflexia bacterium]